MIKTIIAFLDNTFSTPEFPVCIFSSTAIKNKAEFFQSKTTYSESELNLFKSLFGRSLLLDNTESTKLLLEYFFHNIQCKHELKSFLSDLLLSAFKTKKYNHIADICYIYNKNHISFWREDDCFKKQGHKMFYLAKNNHKLMSVLLNAYCFSWITSNFDFDKLIYPVIESSIQQEYYQMFNTITDSLSYKSNYTNRGVYKKASFIAIENNHLHFFEQCECSLPLFKNNLDNWDRRIVEESIYNFLDKFIKQRNETAIKFIIDLMIKKNLHIVSFQSSYNDNYKIVDNIKLLENTEVLKDYINKINLDISVYYADDKDVIEPLKESLFNWFSNSNKESTNDMFSHNFIPKENFIINFFKNNYSLDHSFLNYLLDKVYVRRSRLELDKYIQIAHTKEKFNNF